MAMKSNNRDQIYRSQQENVSKFTFDNNVASVFEDMISRSVPGYRQILELLPTLVKQFHRNGGFYYDLGCSLGAGMSSIAKGLCELTEQKAKVKIIGVDNSQAMLDQAQPLLSKTIKAPLSYQLHCADIADFEIDQAVMVLMNFTLQFIPLEQRDDLLQAIYANLLPNGVLVLSEKVKFSNKATDQTLIEIHHQYKADQGYSELEIAQKRDAIENVLIPETLNTHSSRLRKAGFRIVTPWIQNLQFISILAIK